MTRACIRSLELLDGWPLPTVIVDNGSGTGEGDRLAAEWGENVQSLTLPINGGVGAGYNAAVRRAKTTGARFVLLLNNDVKVAQGDLLERLGAAATPGIAAVGPVIRESHGGIWSAGGQQSQLTGHASHRRKVLVLEAYEADWLDGSAMLVSIDAACQIGGFAEEYFLYWEETDWCARARRAGFGLKIQPDAFIVHERGGTALPLQTRQYALRNSLLFIRRNIRGWRAAVAAILWCSIRIPVFVVRVSRAHGPRSSVVGVLIALRWHARDILRRGWKVHPTGPDVCGPGTRDTSQR
jgi:N-acetylglucosaminyl-diphospho-decaprenol L-rhamnosyltransferase